MDEGFGNLEVPQPGDTNPVSNPGASGLSGAYAPGSSDGSTSNTVEDCTDDDTTAFVKNVVKALQLKNGEVLLAVGFVTKESREYHEMFPRVLGVDVKYGTNNERRPLLRVVGRTGNGKNIPIMNCYLPSEQQYAYFWAIGTALRHCLDESALRKTEIVPTDEDKDQMDALYQVIYSSDKILGDRAKLRLCKWHKVCICAHIVQKCFCASFIRKCICASLYSHIITHYCLVI